MKKYYLFEFKYLILNTTKIVYFSELTLRYGNNYVNKRLGA